MEGLLYLRWLEAKIDNEKIWTESCQLKADSDTICKPPKTIIEMLKVELPSIFSTCSDKNLVEEAFSHSDCTISKNNQARLFDHLHAEKNDLFVMNSFKKLNASRVVQSKYTFGLPIDGYDSADESLKKQQSRIKKQIIALKEWLDKVNADNYGDF